MRAVAAALLVLAAWGDSAARTVHVPCRESGPECGRALRDAIETAPAGATITLEPGKTYEGRIVIKPKTGAAADRVLTITTRGWSDKGSGWDGLVTPADKPKMAVLRAAPRSNVAVEIRDGAAHVALFGLAFEANPPAGLGDVIRIGSGRGRAAAELPSNVSIRQVLIEGSREFGQKRGIAANGQGIEISQVWCEEVFTAGQDAQCIAAWNGGKRVRVHHVYLAAGAENILLGGAPIPTAEMIPEDWVIEDAILHKPLRWRDDRRNRQVKNLLELKQGRNITVRRVLAVNNWRAAQDGTGLLINYTTNGRCPECGGLENVIVEDFVMLNVRGGVSFQGYSWQPNSHNAAKLRNVTLRNAYIQLSGAGRNIQVTNVMDRHDIRIERSTFITQSRAFLTGSFGRVWPSVEAIARGSSMKGLSLVNNVFTSNGRYGITAPDGRHFGDGLASFVSEDLQIAGNVIGDAPRKHLANYNRFRQDGPENVSVSRQDLMKKLPVDACGEWAAGKGADCARLAPVFALRKRLPEP